MNKVVTIGSFTLAVPAFVYIFCKDPIVAVITAVVTLIICCLLFGIENYIKRNDSDPINAFLYLITKSGSYSIEEKRIKYEKLDDTNWKFTKKYTLKSHSNNFDEYEDRYGWSADSSGSEINPIDKSQAIGNVKNHDMWTVFTVRFNKTLNKRNIIETGCVIDKLADKEHKVRPFLSSTVDRKTKILCMTVKMPKGTNLKNAKIEAYSSATANSNTRVYSRNLVFDTSTCEINAKIMYPRLNWRYYICWEE